MKSLFIGVAMAVTLLAGALTPAQAIQCVKGVNRAGCVGANGAVVAGPRGNRMTKGLAPGCALVNGKRVCR